ncbi:MAG: hypothetical protein U0228_23810 [Myxococcaceae bacterium]
MFALVVAAVLGQTLPSLAVPPLSASGIDPVVARAWEERLVERLSSPRWRVTSARDLETLLGMERQRQLLGCESNTSCLAELAGALGVDFVLSASVVRSESGYLASLRIVSTREGRAVAQASERVSTEAALLDWLDGAAHSVRAQVLGEEASAVRWVPAIVGGFLAAGSGVSFAIAASNYGQLVDRRVSGDAIATTRATGERAQWAGVALAAGAAVALAVSVVWNVTATPATRVQPIAATDGSTSWLGVRGTFP